MPPAGYHIIAGLLGCGVIPTGDSRSIDHGAAASVHFQTAPTSTTANRATHIHGDVADFTTESMIAMDYLTFTNHRTANANIRGQVDERCSRFELSVSSALRSIAGNLSKRREIRLIVGFHVKSLNYIESLQIKLLPSKIPRYEQAHVIRDQSRQRQSSASKRIAESHQLRFLLCGKHIQAGKNLLGVGVEHVCVNPLFTHDSAIDVLHDDAVAVSVNLQSHSADPTTFEYQRNAWTPIQRLSERLSLLHNAVIEHQ